jgi:hypothetical protein
LMPPSEDRRSTPRFEVEFRTLITDKSGINDQVGAILDLSLSGCHVRVPIMVYPTLVMELLIYAPDLDRPLFVEKAVVQWVKGDTFGLHFLRLQQAELIRLGRLIASITEDEASPLDRSAWREAVERAAKGAGTAPGVNRPKRLSRHAADDARVRARRSPHRIT